MEKLLNDTQIKEVKANVMAKGAGVVFKGKRKRWNPLRYFIGEEYCMVLDPNRVHLCYRKKGE